MASPCRLSLAMVLCWTVRLSAQEGAGEEKDPASQPPPGKAPDGAAPDPSASSFAVPEFKKESAKEEFDKAKALFDEGKFKEAEALFKRTRPQVKGKEDKAALELWLRGVTGAQSIVKLQALVKQSKVKLAYEQAEIQARKFADTPARDGFKKFLEELAGLLFVPLETFDTTSRDYSEKYGKTFVNDPKLAFDGTQCLRWTNTEDRKAGALKVEIVPRDWSRFEAVEFFVNVIEPPSSPEAAIHCGAPPAGGKQAASKGAAKDYFVAPIRLAGQTGQWQRVRVPILEFKPSGTPSLTSVSHFNIQVGAGKQFEILIDKIVLVKKESAEAGAEKGGRKGQ